VSQEVDMPTTPSTPSQGVLNAIELMTSWLESPDDLSELYLLRLRSHLAERPDADAMAGAVELVMGMTALCGGLLVTLAEASVASESEILQRFALLYAEQD
jgi:hypothetical protein